MFPLEACPRTSILTLFAALCDPDFTYIPDGTFILRQELNPPLMISPMGIPCSCVNLTVWREESNTSDWRNFCKLFQYFLGTQKATFCFSSSFLWPMWVRLLQVSRVVPCHYHNPASSRRLSRAPSCVNFTFPTWIALSSIFCWNWDFKTIFTSVPENCRREKKVVKNPV